MCVVHHNSIFFVFGIIPVPSVKIGGISHLPVARRSPTFEQHFAPLLRANCCCDIREDPNVRHAVS